MTSTGPFRIEPATLWDLHDVVALDERHSPDSEHGYYLRSSIRAGHLWVAQLDGVTVGCTVWNREFFGNPFIWHLFVHPPHRRRGAATELIRHIERLCSSEKIFTSTNESNERMHQLLPRLGFIRCGLVDQLDPGDPEVFYVKLPVSDSQPEGGERAEPDDRR